MYPLLFDAAPTYFVMCVMTGIFVLTVGAETAARAGFHRGQALLVLTGMIIIVIAGAKGQYLLELRLFPGDDYVPQHMRGLFHGFRIPGGIALLGLAFPALCAWAGMDWKSFGDCVIWVVAGGLIILRLGCFLNGCCFGGVTDVSWAVQFPPGSWPYWYHRTHDLLSHPASASLPIHPTQLYWATAALALTLISRRTGRFPGDRLFAFFATFFLTTLPIEFLRARPLSLNLMGLTILSATWAGLWLGQRMSSSICAPPANHCTRTK